MENKEEIYTALEGNMLTWYIEVKYKSTILAVRISLCENDVVEFCRLPNGAVPEVLNEYLNRVALTGITVYVFTYVIISL